MRPAGSATGVPGSVDSLSSVAGSPGINDVASGVLGTVLALGESVLTRASDTLVDLALGGSKVVLTVEIWRLD